MIASQGGGVAGVGQNSKLLLDWVEIAFTGIISFINKQQKTTLLDKITYLNS